MPTENQRSNTFRSDIKSVYPDIHVQNLIDSKQGLYKPYDCYIVHESKFIAVEFKRETGQSINGKCLRDNQVKGLKQASNQGYSGLLIFFLEHSKWQNKQLFCMPIQKFINVFHGKHVGGGVYEWSKSYKIEYLKIHFPEHFICKSKQLSKVKVKNKYVEKEKLQWNFSDLLNLEIFR